MNWLQRCIGIGVGAALLLGSMTAAAQPAADHHQHLFGPATVARSTNLPVIDGPRLIELLDAAHIQRAVVLSVAYQLGNPNRAPVEDEYTKVKAENDWTSQQVALYPKRLRGFCGFNPLRDYALAEIERCAKNRFMRFGIKLHIGNSDVDFDNPAHVQRLQEVFRAADAHRMAIVVHLRSSISQKRPYGARQARTFLNEVVSQAPHSVVQVAHLAGAGPYSEPVADEAMQVFVDAIRNREPTTRKLYFDVSGMMLGDYAAHADRMAQRIREVGVQRVLFGSDGAAGGNPEPKEAWDRFRQLPLTPQEFSTIEKNVAPYLR
jgi:predicted TIM-barrel fold metal-dependent hydrolase